MVTKKNIMDAYLFLRKENHSIPSYALDFMLEASMDKLAEVQKRRESEKQGDLEFSHGLGY